MPYDDNDEEVELETPCACGSSAGVWFRTEVVRYPDDYVLELLCARCGQCLE